MQTFTSNSKSLGNCSTLMVFLPTCSINLFVTSSATSSNPNNSPHSFQLVKVCLPFTGSHSLQIRTQITRLCSAAYPHLNVRFVCRSSTRITCFFPFKEKVPKFFRSGVLYLFKCRCCSASYVGQTTLHLHTEYLNTWESLL